MRNLDESDWFDAPNLKKIKENTTGSQTSTFDLTFVQVNPTAAAEEEQ